MNKILAHPKYRRDIDGLRAIAVLSVVAFHAAPGRLTGGFIGVDIFFVISGYLITTIIIKNLEKDSFNFFEFYSRRIRRIFPALLTVLLASLVLGSLLLTAEEFENLGKHIAGGAGFSANYLLWMESGYFDSASNMKPLLHLWSLAIEEQFYIVWPVLLWFLFKKKISYFVTTLIIILLSFSLNIYAVNNDYATLAFYSPLARAWELLIGSVLSYICLHKKYHLLSQRHVILNALNLVGITLILVGLFFINENSLFPGWWALLPVLGAVLIIFSGSSVWFNRVILSNRVLVWFGLISYPLYLVHWPILSFLRIIESGEIVQINRIYAVLVSIILAWLIVIFVEKPIRFGKSRRFKIATLLSTLVFIGTYGYYVYWQKGFVTRLGSQPQIVNTGDIGQRQFFEYMNDNFYLCMPIELQSKMGSWEEYKRCYQSHKEESNKIVILGDSHAEHLFIGLAEALVDFNVVYYAKGGVPFLSNHHFDEVFHFILNNKDIKVIIVSAHWTKNIQGMENGQIEVKFNHLVETLIDAGKKVYIIDDVPLFDFEPSKCKYSGRLGQVNICSQGIDSFNNRRRDYHPVFDTLSEKYPDLKILYTKSFFCDSQDCFMAKNGVLYYRDANHLNINGSKKLGKYIIQNNSVIQEIKFFIKNELF